MAGADDIEEHRNNGGMPRRRGNGHAAAGTETVDHEAGDDEIEAVNRLMGFLRDDEG
jgi:hypothetical protein